MRLVHDAGMFGTVTIGDLDLAQSPRIFDDQTAALPAPLLEGSECGFACRSIRKLFSKNDPVLDADARARCHVRRRRMHGVAYQDNAAA